MDFPLCAQFKFVQYPDGRLALRLRLREGETPEARATADSRFHIELAIAAQSPRLTNAEIRLQAELGQVLWAPLGPAMDPEQVAAEHLALVHAISSGQADRAREIVLQHVRRNTHHLIDTKLVLRYGPAPEEARP